MNYLCDTVMGICDSDNSGFGYKSVHMEGNYHHSTESKYIKFNTGIYYEHHQKAEEKRARCKNSSPLPSSNLICVMGSMAANWSWLEGCLGFLWLQVLYEIIQTLWLCDAVILCIFL